MITTARRQENPGGPGEWRAMATAHIPAATDAAVITYLNAHQFFGKKLTGDSAYTKDVAEGRVDATDEQISVAKAIDANFAYFQPQPAAAPAAS